MPHNETDEKIKCLYRRDYSCLALKNTLAVLLVVATFAACSPDMTIHVGSRPNIPAIEQRLRVGQSTTDDVLAVLGPPRGKGLATLPIDPKQRITWSYMYLESAIKSGAESTGDMRSLILFIFFEGDRYAGYMWFSSLPVQTSTISPPKPR